MSPKVLIIEDDQFLSGLLSKKLIVSGLDVQVASGGDEGLEKLQSNAPDIMLLDLILPGMDGFGFLEKIKNDEKFKHIPVIVLSNLGSEEDVKKALRLGAEDYMVKAHVLIDDVVAKIRKILKGKEK